MRGQLRTSGLEANDALLGRAATDSVARKPAGQTQARMSAEREFRAGPG
jgi:hypothetical protein